MIAYDVPLSALLFVIYAGVPVDDEYQPTEEETLAYIEMIRKIVADE